MLRSLRGFSWIGVALVLGLALNVFILLRGRQPRSSDINDDANAMAATVEEPLPLPKLVDKKSLILGKRLFKKVRLAIGMLIYGNRQKWYPKAIREIAQQDPKPDGSHSVVVVLLLVERRKKKMQEIIDMLKLEIKDLLSNGYAQLVISTFDLNPKYLESVKNKELNEAAGATALMNFRLAFLYKYCSEVADHAMLHDSEVGLKPGAINMIDKELDNFKPNTLHIDFSDQGVLERLYNGKYLPRVYGTLFAMAQLGGHAAIINTVTDISVHAAKSKYTGDPIFTSYSEPLGPENPPATITAKLQAYGKHKAENAYLRKGSSWFTVPKKGDYLTVSLKDPALLKRIYIETGLDALRRDSFTKAVLELSYSRDMDTKECIRFEAVGSFREEAVIDLAKDEKESSSYLQKPIHCIRIRVTEDFNEWAAIRKFIVETEK